MVHRNLKSTKEGKNTKNTGVQRLTCKQQRHRRRAKNLIERVPL